MGWRDDIKAATQSAAAPASDNSAAILQDKIRKIEKKDDEFNDEKGTFDVLALNLETLNSIVSSTNKKESTQAKYKEHLQEEIKKSKLKIKDLKNSDKLYRRDFIEGKPLTAQPSPFWSNRDNQILTVFWFGILLFMISLMIIIASLNVTEHFTETHRTLLAVITFIFIPLVVLYIVQNFG